MKAGGEWTTNDKMFGWHHQLDGHEFEQAPLVGAGQSTLTCCTPWGHKKSDTTERLNNSNFICNKTIPKNLGKNTSQNENYAMHN